MTSSSKAFRQVRLSNVSHLPTRTLFRLGSHSIHQQLHRVSCLPEGQYAPFQSAILQSNAILYVDVYS